MIRFIVKEEIYDATSGCRYEELITIDGDLVALESFLRGGGRGESGYDLRSLVGVSLPPEAES